MTLSNLSNQSHFPGFFLTLESHLIGFCKSYKMKEGKQCRQWTKTPESVLDVHSVQAACREHA
jgi:hypothetical protein